MDWELARVRFEPRPCVGRFFRGVTINYDSDLLGSPWQGVITACKVLFFFTCRQERARYYSNRQKAIDDPVDCLSMICDGMDQNKTNLPSFVRSTKACQNLWRLRTHLTGCLVHGLGCYSFFDFLQISHDCNLTLTCVLLTIVEVLKQRKLPRRLLLQMDNCVRENKNKYVFGFLAYLVEKKVFSEVN